MENLGRALSMLHSYGDSTGLLSLNPNSLVYIKSYLNRIEQNSDIIQEITEWIDRQDLTPKHTAWVHGNIKSEDIFFNQERVSIIDFGTCGRGNPYEDLANLCTYMILFKAVPFFPWKLAREAMTSLVNGYAAEYKFDADELNKYIAQSMVRYYLKNIVMNSGITTLSGMPVRKKNVQNMVESVIRGEYRPAFPGTHSNLCS